MFTFLLILHLVAVCFWLGGAVYERVYIVGGIRKAKGTELEAPMYKLMLQTMPFFLSAVAVILITGITMTILNNYSFLDWSWLGVKQYIFLAIVLLFSLYIGPRMARLGKQLDANLAQGEAVDDEMRSLTNRLVLLFDIAHLGVLLNLILGVGKFF